MKVDQTLVSLIAVVASILAASTVSGWLFERRLALRHGSSHLTTRYARRVNRRIKGWWAVLAVTGAAVLGGDVAITVVFGMLSFLALREFVTLSPTGIADHMSLVVAFFVLTPAQYMLVGLGKLGAAAVFVPVYCFLVLALRSAVEGDTARFLERTAVIQWGMMACVYCVSHVPMLLALDLDLDGGSEVLVVFWLVVVVQAGDAFTNLADTIVVARTEHRGEAPGRSAVLRTDRTRTGVVVGMCAAAAFGAILSVAAPFEPYMAAAIGAGLGLLGVAGRTVMSAIKHDRGVRYYGVIVVGHGGVLDRIDSLMFAAPIFVHALPWLVSLQ